MALLDVFLQVDLLCRGETALGAFKVLVDPDCLDLLLCFHDGRNLFLSVAVPLVPLELGLKDGGVVAEVAPEVAHGAVAGVHVALEAGLNKGEEDCHSASKQKGSRSTP